MPTTSLVVVGECAFCARYDDEPRTQVRIGGLWHDVCAKCRKVLLKEA